MNSAPTPLDLKTRPAPLRDVSPFYPAAARCGRVPHNSPSTAPVIAPWSIAFAYSSVLGTTPGQSRPIIGISRGFQFHPNASFGDKPVNSTLIDEIDVDIYRSSGSMLHANAATLLTTSRSSFRRCRKPRQRD
jgi:hypothetical protein